MRDCIHSLEKGNACRPDSSFASATMSGQLYSRDDIKHTDILVGKGKAYTDHIGTIAFKALVDVNVKGYMDDATESCDKTFITVEMVDKIHEQGGRFLKETKNGSGQWVEIGKAGAREKVRDALRDAVKKHKKERPRAFLTKINLSVQFNKTHTFTQILRVVSQDPAVERFLRASKAQQQAKSAKKARRESKVAASGTPMLLQQAAARSLPASFRPGSAPILPRPRHGAEPIASSSKCNDSLAMMQFVPVHIPAQQAPLLFSLAPQTPSSVLPTRPVSSTPPPIANCGSNCDCSHGNSRTDPAPPVPRSCRSSQPPLVKSLHADDTTPYDPWRVGVFDDFIGGIDLLSALQRADRVADSTMSDFEDNELGLLDDDSSDGEWLDHLEEFEFEGRSRELPLIDEIELDLDESLLVARI